MNTLGGQLILQLVLILLNAIFACAEIAVLSVSEAKLNKLEESGNKKAKKLRKLIEQPSRFLSTIQVAITLAGFLGSAFAADNFATRLTAWCVSKSIPVPEETVHTIAVVLVTLLLSYVTLILGELVPKRLAMRKSEAISLALADLLVGVANLFRPIVWLLTVSTNGVLRLFGVDPNAEDEDVSEENIRLMVDEGESKGVIAETEKEMIQNVFEFDDLTVDVFATHRTDTIFLRSTDDMEKWESIIHESRHSVYPVCGETNDDVIGVLNVKDFFRLRNEPMEVILKEAIRPALFVTDGIHADVLFRQMKSTHNHFAVVLDEYGGVFGVVTMNDLLEQLVGDFNTNPDDPEEEVPMIEQLSEDTWQIQGIMPLGDVEKELEIELPTDLYDTMGGYVFSNYGMIPDDGTEFETDIDRMHIHVTDIVDHRIERMIVTLAPLPTDEDEEDDEDDDDEDKKKSKSKDKEKDKDKDKDKEKDKD